MTAFTTVLVLNSGSSSVKYQVIALPSEEVLDRGQRDRVGIQGGDFSSHWAAIRDILDALRPGLEVTLVGHRVVHGGSTFVEPVVIDDRVIDAIGELNTLAPLHNPANLEGILAARDVLPDVPHIAVFDTAFFASLDSAAYTYAIPLQLSKDFGIRKYGFHGTSHQYVSAELERLSGPSITSRRAVIFHLGNGSSVSAVKGGVAIDTSMGFTPLAGLVMGSRSGDIDPVLPLYLQSALGMTANEVDELLNRDSGLRGLSGHSDMRDVFSAAESGDEPSQLAIDVWVWRARHYLGAYMVHLGGLDAIVFTGGIGENQADLRRRICENMDSFGVVIDDELNRSSHRGSRRLSADDSAVEVWVIPTNEELQIARLSHALVAGQR